MKKFIFAIIFILAMAGSGFSQSQCVIERVLPDSYTPGMNLTVQLLVKDMSHNMLVFTVEDYPPAGWSVVSDISCNGEYDKINHKVKFGEYYTDNQCGFTLSYQIRPPADTTGGVSWGGYASVDGTRYEICGDTMICGFHPADTAGYFVMSDNEVTKYGYDWKRGEIAEAKEFVSCAGQLWKRGEKYECCDPDIQTCVCLNWKTRYVQRRASLPASVIRTLPEKFTLCNPIEINLIIINPDNDAFVIEETLPSGCVFLSATHGGAYDSVNNSIKFGVLYDTDISLSYYVMPSDVPKIEFAGEVSFAGDNAVISGDSMIISDNRPDLQDAIYILQVLTGLR